MKKIGIFTLMMMAGLLGAQVQKGMLMVGGMLNFNGQNDQQMDSLGKPTQKINNNSLALGIRAGYLLTGNFMLGITLSEVSNTSVRENIYSATSDNKVTTRGSTFAPGLFARYYKNIGNSHFAFFGQLGASMGSGYTKVTNSSTSSGVTVSTETRNTSTSLNVYLQPGITYFLSRRIAVETYFGDFGFSTSSAKMYDKNGKQTSESTTSLFNSKLNFNLSNIWLGVNFYFGGSDNR